MVTLGQSATPERGLSHFGVHLMLDGYGGAAEALADWNVVLAWLKCMPGALGMRPLAEPFVLAVDPLSEKDPGGLSGFVLIAESHLSVHTFPERGFASADVYTCQSHLEPDPICEQLIASFGLSDVESQLVLRGIRYAETHAGSVVGAPTAGYSFRAQRARTTR